MQTYDWDKATLFANSELTAKDAVKNFAGTTGKSKRMEALEINFIASEGVTLKYRAHVQTYGWQDWVTADNKGGHTKIVGTTGESKRMEALQISVEGLTEYKVLYRAHVQGDGWQDWVDADDVNAFAGTTGQSKRMEAIEIVVLDADDYTYSTSGTAEGKHTVSYKGTMLGTQDCSYGPWESTEGDKLERHCSLCGRPDSKKTTLQEVLSEALNKDGKVSIDDEITLNGNLSIPRGTTLEAESIKVEEGGRLVNDGEIVVKTADPQYNERIENNGKFTVTGKYVEEEVEVLEDALGCSYVTNIVVEKDSVGQTISETVEVTADKLKVDLNGTTVTSEVASDYMIKNEKADLTINDGKFVSNTGAGIQTLKNLTINGGSITAKGGAGIRAGVDPKDETDKVGLKDVKVQLNNVKITTENSGNYGVEAVANNANVTLNNCEVTSERLCLATNAVMVNSGFTVIGGKLTSTAEDSMVAYLPAVGTNTFSGVEMKGAAGVEVTSGTLNITNKTKIITTGDANEALRSGTVTTGGSNDGGFGILAKLSGPCIDKDNKTLKINVTNSTITSEKDYAIMVVESSTVKSDMTSVNVAIKGSTITAMSKETESETARDAYFQKITEVEEPSETEKTVNVTLSYTK